MNDSSGLQVVVDRGVTVVTLGEKYETLDELKVEELSEPLLAVAGEATPPLLVVNLAHTRFFGSSFIALLFRTRTRLTPRNGKMAVCGLQGYCIEVMEVAHLNQLWHICPDSAEAVTVLLDGSEAASS